MPGHRRAGFFTVAARNLHTSYIDAATKVLTRSREYDTADAIARVLRVIQRLIQLI
jgi:hypothetical protein